MPKSSLYHKITLIKNNLHHEEYDTIDDYKAFCFRVILTDIEDNDPDNALSIFNKIYFHKQFSTEKYNLVKFIPHLYDELLNLATAMCFASKGKGFGSNFYLNDIKKGCLRDVFSDLYEWSRNRVGILEHQSRGNSVKPAVH